MGFLRGAARAYLLNRMLRGSRRHPRYGGYSGYGSRHGRRRSSGFGMRGPFPTYSRRSRGGSRVTVSGCCLPIPLALTVGAAVALTRAVRSP
jgi:hypothetical protein